MGTLASNNYHKKMITDLLDWAENNLWKNQKELGDLGREYCRKFYYDKTFSRIDDLLLQIKKTDKKELINQ